VLLRKEKTDLKKALLMQTQKFYTLPKEIDITMYAVTNAKSELKRTPKGQILASKLQLEQTVIHLTKEIELLSFNNEQLIQDLKVKTFFEKYHEALEELNQLKQDQELLVDFKLVDFKLDDSKTSNISRTPSLSMLDIYTPAHGSNYSQGFDFSSAMVTSRSDAISISKPYKYESRNSLIITFSPNTQNN
jgi:hypothetical protein